MINENTKKDDVGFFNRLYNQYYQKIYKYILFITGVRFSEDIVQETFCTAWEKLYEIKTHPSPQNWLYKTARNKIMTTMKKKMNICETPIPECCLSIFISLLVKIFFKSSKANSMKIGTGTMKFSRMYKKIKNSKC